MAMSSSGGNGNRRPSANGEITGIAHTWPHPMGRFDVLAEAAVAHFPPLLLMAWPMRSRALPLPRIRDVKTPMATVAVLALFWRRSGRTPVLWPGPASRLDGGIDPAVERCRFPCSSHCPCGRKTNPMRLLGMGSPSSDRDHRRRPEEASSGFRPVGRGGRRHLGLGHPRTALGATTHHPTAGIALHALPMVLLASALWTWAMASILSATPRQWAAFQPSAVRFVLAYGIWYGLHAALSRRSGGAISLLMPVVGFCPGCCCWARGDVEPTCRRRRGHGGLAVVIFTGAGAAPAE